MNLFPLIFAVLFIVIYAVVVAVWTSMDPQAKRLLFIVTAVAVVLCIIAVFWPLLSGHMVVGNR